MGRKKNTCLSLGLAPCAHCAGKKKLKCLKPFAVTAATPQSVRPEREQRNAKKVAQAGSLPMPQYSDAHIRNQRQYERSQVQRSGARPPAETNAHRQERYLRTVAQERIKELRATLGNLAGGGSGMPATNAKRAFDLLQRLAAGQVENLAAAEHYSSKPAGVEGVSRA